MIYAIRNTGTRRLCCECTVDSSKVTAALFSNIEKKIDADNISVINVGSIVYENI